MRADRLVSLLLLLQSRGRLTAARLADELEVSVRTVYRDVDALHSAGIPLYGEAGHAGGYQLLAGYRTRLTGMTAGEVQALFLAGAPQAAEGLGLGPVLAAARLKVRAALPAELGEHADLIGARFHLDTTGWYAAEEDTPQLRAVADAVWKRRALHVRYSRWQEPTEIERRLEPYGLVLKAGRWYAVASAAGGSPRTYRVDQIRELAVLDEEFEPPRDFDLAAYWAAYQADFPARLYQEEALVRLSPRGLGLLSGAEAAAAERGGQLQDDGWTRAVLPVESVDHAHDAFLRLGADVEVLEPEGLRERIAATASALAALYADPSGSREASPAAPSPAAPRSAAPRPARIAVSTAE